MFLQNDYPYLVFENLILGRVENRRQTFFFLFIMGEIRYNKSQTGTIVIVRTVIEWLLLNEDLCQILINLHFTDAT